MLCLYCISSFSSRAEKNKSLFTERCNQISIESTPLFPAADRAARTRGPIPCLGLGWSRMGQTLQLLKIIKIKIKISHLYELKSQIKSLFNNLGVVTGALIAQNVPHEVQIPIPTEGILSPLTAGLCSATSKGTHRPLHDHKQQSELFSQQKKPHHIAELLVNLTVLEKKMDNMTACLSAASWMSLFCDNTIRNLCRCSHCSSVLVALGTIILNLYAKVFWDHLWEYHFAQ